MNRKLALLLLLISPSAFADPVTISWDLYKDVTVSNYDPANYELQILCRKNAEPLTQLVKVKATVTTAIANPTLLGGDTFGCVIKAHRLSPDQWGVASAEVTIAKALAPPSTPSGLKLFLEIVIGALKEIMSRIMGIV